jgi:hypothetical protein
MDASRRASLFMTLAIVVGLVVFAGVRLGSLLAPSGSDPWSDPGTTAWPVVPMLFAYVGATSIGLVLLGDGVTRWWWLLRPYSSCSICHSRPGSAARVS